MFLFFVIFYFLTSKPLFYSISAKEVQNFCASLNINAVKKQKSIISPTPYHTHTSLHYHTSQPVNSHGHFLAVAKYFPFRHSSLFTPSSAPPLFARLC